MSGGGSTGQQGLIPQSAQAMQMPMSGAGNLGTNQVLSGGPVAQPGYQGYPMGPPQAGTPRAPGIIGGAQMPGQMQMGQPGIQNPPTNGIAGNPPYSQGAFSNPYTGGYWNQLTQRMAGPQYLSTQGPPPQRQTPGYPYLYGGSGGGYR